jgi:hypothetical protein
VQNACEALKAARASGNISIYTDFSAGLTILDEAKLGELSVSAYPDSMIDAAYGERRVLDDSGCSDPRRSFFGLGKMSCGGEVRVERGE